MNRYGCRSFKHCRWCGRSYRAHKPYNKDGFCTTAHKQALYRARKMRYGKKISATRPAGTAVTRKVRKGKKTL